MMRVYGSRGAKPVECINKPKDKWVARWDFRDEEDGGASYEEEVFDHKPTVEDIETAKQKRAEQVRAELAAKIVSHDTSGAVNSFTVKVAGMEVVDMWLNREERSALRIRFEVEQRAGTTTTTLWASGGLCLTISPTEGLVMLDQIELYAAACYDSTQQHLVAVSQLSSRAECDEYDYADGYPPKLTFNA